MGINTAKISCVLVELPSLPLSIPLVLCPPYHSHLDISARTLGQGTMSSVVGRDLNATIAGLRTAALATIVINPGWTRTITDYPLTPGRAMEKVTREKPKYIAGV